jgi:hypothetical protein
MLRLVGEGADASRWRVASLMPLPSAAERDWLARCEEALDPTTPVAERIELAEEVLEDMGFLWALEEGEGGRLSLDMLLMALRPECDRLTRAREEHNGGVAVGAVLDTAQVVDLLTRLAHRGHAVVWLSPRQREDTSVEYSAIVQCHTLWAVRQAFGVRERLQRSALGDAVSGPDCVWLPSRLRYVARRLRAYSRLPTIHRILPHDHIGAFFTIMVHVLTNYKHLVLGFARGLEALCRNPDFWDRQVAEYYQFLVEHIASTAGSEREGAAGEEQKEAAAAAEGGGEGAKGKEGEAAAPSPPAMPLSSLHERVRRLFQAPHAFSPQQFQPSAI